MDTRIKAVLFDEEAHTYTYLGKRLNGITGVIGSILGKHYSEASINVQLGRIYGDTVHKEIENYYNNNGKLSTEASKWIVEELSWFMSTVDGKVSDIKCEVMVSDFVATASKIDIVLRYDTDKAVLFDIKTTSRFDRPYCSLQLSVYKELYEKCYGGKVTGMYVLGTKMRRRFHILYQGSDLVARILDENERILKRQS